MKLSVYIICLNDDEWIGHALEYAYTIADEIVVVDGGSNDQTVKKIIQVEAHGTRPIYFYERPMPDSFADQRNYAIDQCSGDWILHMDADERYTRGLRDLLLPMLPTVPDEVLAFSFPSWYLAEDERHYQNEDADPHVRLFRNRPDLRYVRPVHEHIALNGRILAAHPCHFGDLEQRVVRYQPDVHLLHYGSLRSDRAYSAWRDRWQRFAARSSEYGINVDALVRHPQAIGEIPEEEIP